MRFSLAVGFAAAFTTANAQLRGFNYGSEFSTGAAKQQVDFEYEFNAAKSLPGTSGFTSARLYTMIQGGTTNDPISAIPAAIATGTTLLLGLWASAGAASFNNEVAALNSAISQYGTSFTDLIIGISVGSEDLYRISPTGINNLSGAGAEPSELEAYIGQVRSAIANTGASGKPVGHVDTWTAWVNGSNSAVVNACDFLGMDAYPYYQTTMANSISTSKATFFDAYDATVGAANGKSVWVTETGWPVSGPTKNQAVASVANARTYWSEVACTLLGSVSTFWYTLQDAQPATPNPSFGIKPAGDLMAVSPLYDLSCPAGTNGAAVAAL
ncbi:glycoside hydrolase family 17 protein [Lepidopterella palustris CBS 459.81]|uniref:Probable glucan endo-1,3-beta-glucosidase eglC n=1 Tax=Lepidopterella palustris CBS 459.81 TaxID=1314670 RepID=A0A8E2E3V5_9PEZI|nr:glycoside hydrolase family 17 protein [Lepidopterella palustris CBS 459.81]